MSRSRLSIFGLCALMVSAGVMHFVAPTPYRRIVPAPLRGHAAGVVAVRGAAGAATHAAFRRLGDGGAVRGRVPG